MLQDSEFKIFEEIAKVIKPFCRIMSQTSGEEYVTVSALKPLSHYLVNTLKTLLVMSLMWTRKQPL